MLLKPEALFDAFLRHAKNKGGIQMSPKILHRLFYKAALKHPREMQSFAFLLRTEPYSPTVARLVWEFQQANQLSRMNPDYQGYIPKTAGNPMFLEDKQATNRVVKTLVKFLNEAVPA